jgi:N-acyl-D-aspartate/D-glutamate deacylase
MEKRRGQTAGQPDFAWVGDDRIIASATWLDADGKQAERYQVLTIRDGKIVDIQGCATRQQAERFVRRDTQ